MLTTQQMVDHEIGLEAEKHGLKVTSDVGHQGNVITYRTYDKDYHLIGTVTVHFEESYASIVNYAGRDAGESYRYGDSTINLVKEVFTRLRIWEETEGRSGQTQAAKATEKPRVAVPTENGAEIEKTKSDPTKKKAISDAFPFQAF